MPHPQTGPPKLLPDEDLQEGVGARANHVENAPARRVTAAGKPLSQEIKRESLPRRRLHHDQGLEFRKTSDDVEQRVGPGRDVTPRLAWHPRLPVHHCPLRAVPPIRPVDVHFLRFVQHPEAVDPRGRDTREERIGQGASDQDGIRPGHCVDAPVRADDGASSDSFIDLSPRGAVAHQVASPRDSSPRRESIAQIPHLAMVPRGRPANDGGSRLCG